jgi:hypothetical protein
MNTFIGFVLLASGLPCLAGACLALRLAQGRAEHVVAGVALVLFLAAVVGGGMLLTSQ